MAVTKQVSWYLTEVPKHYQSMIDYPKTDRTDLRIGY